MMILGYNGYIWLTRVLTENEIKVKDLFDINMDSAAEKVKVSPTKIIVIHSHKYVAIY